MLKDFSKYAFSNIFIKATSFIIPLILAYYYTEAEYGEISLGYTYINFFSMFFAFGFCESIQRFYSNIKELNEKDILGNVFVFDLILVFFFSVFFFIAFPPVISPQSAACRKCAGRCRPHGQGSRGCPSARCGPYP